MLDRASIFSSRSRHLPVDYQIRQLTRACARAQGRSGSDRSSDPCAPSRTTEPSGSQGSEPSRYGYSLLAKVEPPVGTADRRRHDIAGLEIFRAAALRLDKKAPERALGQQLNEPPHRRRRYPQRAAARRSGQQHVARRHVGEGGQFRNGFPRLEHQIGRGVVLPQRAVDAKLQFEIVKKRKFAWLQRRQPWAERTETAIALALEELHLWQLHVARADVVGDTQRQRHSAATSRA